MPNRLSRELSPYLQQHAHNPVDWYPWGAEALERARRENKPIFLSIGYSACHWCHVMERESFEDREAAGLLNRSFIAIKVDREERPDLDELYMAAVQLLTGQGGWPLSVFLLPDGRPFYGGTYFPLRSAPGQLGFLSLLAQLEGAWRTRTAEVEALAEELTHHLQKATRQRPLVAPHAFEPTALLSAAVAELRERFDPTYAGFGGAPKFPPYHDLRLLQTPAAQALPGAQQMLYATLDHMALGGLYDHVGGGFHRYSTDARWLLPHFEKMLSDNALLIRVYASAYQATHNATYARVVRETCDWALETLQSPEGGFYSALDADSEGEEGKYYRWTHAEVATLVGEAFCQHYHLSPEGNYLDEAAPQLTGQNIPYLRLGLHPLVSPEALPEALSHLRAHRQAQRVAPRTDDKVITAWNGLMITALATAGKLLDEPRYRSAAQQAAQFCLTQLSPQGQLHHQSIRGATSLSAFLDDYAYLADGLLDLAEATQVPYWRTEAERLMHQLLEEFWDAEDTGFFYTSPLRHEPLIARTKELFDGALPSPNAVAARVLLRLGGAPAERGLQMVRAFYGLMDRAPQAMATWIETCSALSLAETLGLEALEACVTLAPGEHAQLRFLLALPPGWHINPESPELPTLFATQVELVGSLPGTAGPVQFPTLFTGECVFTVPVSVAGEAQQGSYPLTLRVRFQPCSSYACHAPRESSALTTIVI